MSNNKTALYDSHVSLGAHMVEFASTLLPVRYQSEKEEHLAVRNAVGIFDISHMGEIFVNGLSASTFLQKVLSNNLEQLPIHQAQYTLMLNDDGGIIDDLIIYRLEENNFLLCVNAATIQKDLSHLRALATAHHGLVIENASDQISLLAVQGPKALSLLQSMTKGPLPQRYFIKEMVFFGINTMVAHTGYTGEDGFEIFLNNKDAKALFSLLLSHGQAFGIKPCGLAARDSLRLQAGLLLYGQDMDETTTPLQANLMFAVDLNKHDFIGRNALLMQKKQGIKKKLMGFCLDDRGIARHGHKIMDLDQREIGVVTSGTLLPNQPQAVGLAYIHQDFAKKDQAILIDIRGRLTKGHLRSAKFITK